MPGAFSPDPTFEANPRTIENLLSNAHTGALALPDFQRDFTWEARRTQELLRTVMSRHPAGSLLFWRLGGDNAAFANRMIEGAPTATALPSELVLDGQQRITSLYQALMNCGDERYFVRLNELLDKNGPKATADVDFDKAVYWVNKDTAEYAGKADEAWQFANRELPVDLIFEFDEWLDKLARAQHFTTSDEEDALKRQLRAARDLFLTPLRAYGFPVVTLPSQTPIDAVCTVFETLNRTAKPLGPFELLTARFFPQDVKLRDLWDDALSAYPAIEDFDVDPYSLLQSVTLRARNSAQRADVLKNLDAAQVKDEWPRVANGFNWAIGWLRKTCGVISPRWLPYSMILVPIAAVAHELTLVKPLEQGPALERLERYFWCTVFTANYDQGANSQAGADYIRLNDWLFDPARTPPEAVANFTLSASVVRNATTRRKALYAGLIALVVRNGAKDFHTASDLATMQPSGAKIDSHHIFPKAYLKKQGVALSSELILNRTLIDNPTNTIIGAKAPSRYVADMAAVYPAAKIEEVFMSHLIDPTASGALLADEYPRFVEQRCESVVGLIESVTQIKVTRD